MSKRKPGHAGDLQGKRASRDGKPQKRAVKRPSSGRPNADNWIYGQHAALAAVNNPDRRLHRILVTKRFGETHADELPGGAADIVDRREIEAVLVDGAVHQGIAVNADPLAAPRIQDVLDMIEGQAETTMVILDQATDPRNVGAVLRSAAAFGCCALVVHDRNAAPVSGVLAKAASGALETVPIVYATNLVRELHAIKEAGFWCTGLDGAAERSIADVDASGRVAVVLGAEGAGLRRLTRETCDTLARIPMAGEMDSLNLSNAAAIALYEVARRRLMT